MSRSGDAIVPNFEDRTACVTSVVTTQSYLSVVAEIWRNEDMGLDSFQYFLLKVRNYCIKMCKGNNKLVNKPVRADAPRQK